MVKELFKISWTNIWKRKRRSLLLILSISISIALLSFLFMLSLSIKGNLNYYMSDFNPRGVIFGYFNEKTLVSSGLTQNDVQKINNLDYYEKAVPLIQHSTDLYSVDDNKKEIIIIELPKEEVNWWIDNFNFIGEQYDYSVSNNEVIIGNNIASFIGKNEGDYFFIENEKYKIKKIIKSTKTKIDDTLIKPTIISDKNTKISAIAAIVKSNYEFIESINNAKKIIATDKNANNIIVTSVDDKEKKIEKIIDIIFLSLIFMTFLSFLVSFFVFLNMSYTNIYERKKEIATLRAIGATKQDIFFLFVTESSLYFFISSLIGVFLGIIIVLITSAIIRNIVTYFTIIINPFVLIIIIITSIFFGVFSGIFSAYSASTFEINEGLRDNDK